MRKPKKIAFSTIACMVFAGVALGHSGATGVVKERMDSMTALATSMKSLATMAKSGVVDPVNVSAISQDLIAHSGQSMLDRFPEGTLPDVSEASPAIWQDWDGFRDLAFDLEALAVELDEHASSPDLALQRYVKDIGSVCGACHEDFRVKK